ncbi:unnamed protein product [Caenorhabditis brenneri]
MNYYLPILALLVTVGTAAVTQTCADKGTPQYCQDNKEFCDDPFGSDTRYYCKKTCGLCQDATSAPGNDCSDRGTPAYCNENKDSCDDPFGSDTRYYCRKTCGLCKDPNEVYTTKAPGPVIIKTTVQEICKDNQSDCLKNKYMCTNAMFPEFKEGCRKTCGLCVDPNDPTTTKPPCQDKSTGCEQKKYMCTNAMFPEFKYDCMKTCGLC